MQNETPKTINALMKYLRDEKGISIGGSSQKRKLRNIGYYHGYKGYRFIRKPSNQVKYSDYNELLAVYEFDSQIPVSISGGKCIIDFSLVGKRPFRPF